MIKRKKRMLSGESIVLSSFLAEFMLLRLIDFYCIEYRYFDEHNSASVINKVNSDLGEAEHFLSETFVRLLTDGIVVIIYANYV